MISMVKVLLVGLLIAATSSHAFAHDSRAVDTNEHVDGELPYFAGAQNHDQDGLLRNADELLKETERDIQCAHAPNCRLYKGSKLLGRQQAEVV